MLKHIPEIKHILNTTTSHKCFYHVFGPMLSHTFRYTCIYSVPSARVGWGQRHSPHQWSVASRQQELQSWGTVQPPFNAGLQMAPQLGQGSFARRESNPRLSTGATRHILRLNKAYTRCRPPPPRRPRNLPYCKRLRHAPATSQTYHQH